MENRIVAVVYVALIIPAHIMAFRRLKSSFRNKEIFGRNFVFSCVVSSHLLCGIPQLFYVFLDPLENKTCILKRIIFFYAHHLEDFVTTSSLLSINMFFLKKLHWCLQSKNNPFKKFEHLLFVNVVAFIVTINAIIALYFIISLAQDIDGCRTMFPRNVYMFCYSFISILLLNLIICSKCLLTNSYKLIDIHNSGKFTNVRFNVMILTGINILTMMIYFPHFVLQNNYFYYINESLALYWIYRLKILLLPALYFVFPDSEAFCCPQTKGRENGTYLTVLHKRSDEDLSQICLQLGETDIHDSARICEILRQYRVSRIQYSFNASHGNGTRKHHHGVKHTLGVPEQPWNRSELRAQRERNSEHHVYEFDFSDTSDSELSENFHVYEEIDGDSNPIT